MIGQPIFVTVGTLWIASICEVKDYARSSEITFSLSQYVIKQKQYEHLNVSLTSLPLALINRAALKDRTLGVQRKQAL